MRRFLPIVLILLLLTGCSDSVPDKEVVKVWKAKNKERVESKLSKGPDTRTHTLPAGQLLVMEVPVSDYPGGLDSQRCFVWRDTEFKTAAVSCPSPDAQLGESSSSP